MSQQENTTEEGRYELLAYEVTVTQDHSATYVIRAPSAEEAQRVARERWDVGDYRRYHPLQTRTTLGRRVPEHDNDPLPDDCICPVIVSRIVDPQPWCPLHGTPSSSESEDR